MMQSDIVDVALRKKYRKMKVKFEHTMRASNINYRDEQQAAETARRLAEENEYAHPSILSNNLQTDVCAFSELLELLLDVNSSPQIPGHQRIDLKLESPPISALPALVSDNDPMQGIDASVTHGDQPDKSLRELLKSTPHIPLSVHETHHTIPSELLPTSAGTPPPAYLSPAQVDAYLYKADVLLNQTPTYLPSDIRTPIHLSDKDLAIQNPNSVYNWLREHEPKIFLQDGEGSEKSSGKPGALRGAGKRASIPAPSKPDTVEFVEEDGMGYDISLSGVVVKGKRKRDDDGGYRPKGGAARPTKKKKGDGEDGANTPSVKGKGRGSRGGRTSVGKVRES